MIFRSLISYKLLSPIEHVTHTQSKENVYKESYFLKLHAPRFAPLFETVFSFLILYFLLDTLTTVRFPFIAYYEEGR